VHLKCTRKIGQTHGFSKHRSLEVALCRKVNELASEIRINSQFRITRALHFAQPQAYYQASVTVTLGRRI